MLLDGGNVDRCCADLSPQKGGARLDGRGVQTISSVLHGGANVISGALDLDMRPEFLWLKPYQSVHT